MSCHEERYLDSYVVSSSMGALGGALGSVQVTTVAGPPPVSTTAETATDPTIGRAGSDESSRSAESVLSITFRRRGGRSVGTLRLELDRQEANQHQILDADLVSSTSRSVTPGIAGLKQIVEGLRARMPSQGRPLGISCGVGAWSDGAVTKVESGLGSAAEGHHRSLAVVEELEFVPLTQLYGPSAASDTLTAGVARIRTLIGLARSNGSGLPLRKVDKDD